MSDARSAAVGPPGQSLSVRKAVHGLGYELPVYDATTLGRDENARSHAIDELRTALGRVNRARRQRRIDAHTSANLATCLFDMIETLQDAG